MTNKTYYEAHITMEVEQDPEFIDAVEASVQSIGWKFSQIAGDINLGAGIKLYATRQMNSRVGDGAAVQALQLAAESLRKLAAEMAVPMKVLREKVEVVIFDTRSSKVQACTDCAACQESR